VARDRRAIRGQSYGHPSAPGVMREILAIISSSGIAGHPERLRFDFTHFTPLTQDEIVRIEQRVNEKIRANVTVATSCWPGMSHTAGGHCPFW